MDAACTAGAAGSGRFFRSRYEQVSLRVDVGMAELAEVYSWQDFTAWDEEAAEEVLDRNLGNLQGWMKPFKEQSHDALTIDGQPAAAVCFTGRPSWSGICPAAVRKRQIFQKVVKR